MSDPFFNSSIHLAVSIRIVRIDVINTSFMRQHAEFIIEVNSGTKISLCKRYRDFVELNKAIENICKKKHDIPICPPKKFWGNMNPDFLEKRRADLETYLQNLLLHSEANASKTLWLFLDADDRLMATVGFLGELSDELTILTRISSLRQYVCEGGGCKKTYEIIIYRLTKLCTLTKNINLLYQVFLTLSSLLYYRHVTYDVLVVNNTLQICLTVLEQNADYPKLRHLAMETCTMMVDLFPGTLLALLKQPEGLPLIYHIAKCPSYDVLHGFIGLLLWLALDSPEVQIALAEHDSYGMNILGSFYNSTSSNARIICGLIVLTLLINGRFQNNNDVLSQAAKSVSCLPGQLQDLSCYNLRLLLFQDKTNNLKNDKNIIKSVINLFPFSEFARNAAMYIINHPITIYENNNKNKLNEILSHNPILNHNFTNSAIKTPMLNSTSYLSLTKKSNPNTKNKDINIVKPPEEYTSQELDFVYLYRICCGAKNLTARLIDLITKSKNFNTVSADVSSFLLWLISSLLSQCNHIHLRGLLTEGDLLKLFESQNILDNNHNLIKTPIEDLLKRVKLNGLLRTTGTWATLNKFVNEEKELCLEPLHLCTHLNFNIHWDNQYCLTGLDLPLQPPWKCFLETNKNLQSLINNLFLTGVQTDGRLYGACVLFRLPWMNDDDNNSRQNEFNKKLKNYDKQQQQQFNNNLSKIQYRTLVPTINFIVSDEILLQRTQTLRVILDFCTSSSEVQRTDLIDTDSKLRCKEEVVQSKQSTIPLSNSILQEFMSDLAVYETFRKILLSTSDISRDYINHMRTREESQKITQSSLLVGISTIETELQTLQLSANDLINLKNNTCSLENLYRSSREETDDLLKHLVSLNSQGRKLKEKLLENNRRLQQLRASWLETEKLVACLPERKELLMSQIAAKNKYIENISQKLQEINTNVCELEIQLKQDNSEIDEQKKLKTDIARIIDILQRWIKYLYKNEKNINKNEKKNINLDEHEDHPIFQITKQNDILALKLLINELPEKVRDHKDINNIIKNPGTINEWTKSLQGLLINISNNEIKNPNVKNLTILRDKRKTHEIELKKVNAEIKLIEQSLLTQTDSKGLTDKSSELQKIIRKTETEIETLKQTSLDLQEEIKVVELQLDNKKQKTRKFENEFLSSRETLQSDIDTSNKTRINMCEKISSLDTDMSDFLLDSTSCQEDREHIHMSLTLIELTLEQEVKARSQFKSKILKMILVLQETANILDKLDGNLVELSN